MYDFSFFKRQLILVFLITHLLHLCYYSMNHENPHDDKYIKILLVEEPDSDKISVIKESFSEIENINQTFETKEDLLDNKTQTGKAFVKFFKYGKHSLLWRGINGGTITHILWYSSAGKDDSIFIKTKVDIILNLFSFCYDYKYMIKDRLGLFLNCSCWGGFSNFSLLSDRYSLPFLNFNFGVSYILLHEKNFLWNIYAGIGIMWGHCFFSSLHSYVEKGTLITQKEAHTYIEGKGGLFKSEIWKKYFTCEIFKQNIKNFDVIFDCSAFDFTIKDHFRVTLEWKGGICNIYNIIRGPFPLFDKFSNICLTNLSINIGYVF